MKRKGQITSAITPLIPTSIINTRTGEYVDQVVLDLKITLLLDTILAETNRLYSLHKETLLTDLETYTGRPAAAEFGRQKGYLTSFITTLPREVKAKSRLEKLVQFKLISETASFVLNPMVGKQEPSFSRIINLGAVDKQMVSMARDEAELSLVWKCWDEEYYLTFDIPAYVLKRDIVKFSLPMVRQNKKTGISEFAFSIVETTKQRKGHAHIIGIDLGQVKPYSMVVVNKTRQRVASYESSPRLTQLSYKRERLLSEIGHIKARITNRAARGLTSPVHEVELGRTRGKANRLTKTIALQTGGEIALKLAKHNSNTINMESLKWLSGHANSKIGSSRWSHSAQREAIVHATARIGYSTRLVSARDTSQECYRCKARVTHNSRLRTVYCGACKSDLDRDFNAAMNIAIKHFPVSKKLNGLPLLLLVVLY